MIVFFKTLEQLQGSFLDFLLKIFADFLTKREFEFQMKTFLSGGARLTLEPRLILKCRVTLRCPTLLSIQNVTPPPLSKLFVKTMPVTLPTLPTPFRNLFEIKFNQKSLKVKVCGGCQLKLFNNFQSGQSPFLCNQSFQVSV